MSPTLKTALKLDFGVLWIWYAEDFYLPDDIFNGLVSKSFWYIKVQVVSEESITVGVYSWSYFLNMEST